MKILFLFFTIISMHLLIGCAIYKVYNISDNKVKMTVELKSPDSFINVKKVFNKAIKKKIITLLYTKKENYRDFYEFEIFPKKTFDPNGIIGLYRDTSEYVILRINKSNISLDTIYYSLNGKVVKNSFIRRSYLFIYRNEYFIY